MILTSKVGNVGIVFSWYGMYRPRTVMNVWSLHRPALCRPVNVFFNWVRFCDLHEVLFNYIELLLHSEGSNLLSLILVRYRYYLSYHNLLFLSTCGYKNMDQATTVSCFLAKFYQFGIFIFPSLPLSFFVDGGEFYQLLP